MVSIGFIYEELPQKRASRMGEAVKIHVEYVSNKSREKKENLESAVIEM